jgi:hypothetical protein
MKSGPCLRVEEPVAVAAVFDGRLTLTNVRRYVAHHLAVCSAPSITTECPPEVGQRVGRLLDLWRKMLPSHWHLSFHWLLSFQASPHERVTLQGTSVHRFSEAHLLIASAPAVFLIASALGVLSMGSRVDVRHVEHAAPPHTAACMRTGRMPVGSTRPVALHITRLFVLDRPASSVSAGCPV